MASEKTAVPLDMEKEPISPEVTGTAPEEVLKHANDADEAMKAFAGQEGELLVLDEATNKRLLRKIDMNLMPVCPHPRFGLDNADRLGTASLCHLWSQLPGQYGHGLTPSMIAKLTNAPETTLSYASVMGIRKDIHLTGDNYQWLGSMFYIGTEALFSMTEHGPEFTIIQDTLPGSTRPTDYCNAYPWPSIPRYVS